MWPRCQEPPQCSGVKLRAERVRSHQLEDILMLAYVNCSNRTSEAIVFKPDSTSFGPAPANTDLQKWKFGELGGGDASWVLAQNSKVKPDWQSNCSQTYYAYQEQHQCALYTAASYSVTSLDSSGGHLQ